MWPRCAVYFPARCHLCPIQAPCERMQRSSARTFDELAAAYRTSTPGGEHARAREPALGVDGPARVPGDWALVDFPVEVGRVVVWQRHTMDPKLRRPRRAGGGNREASCELEGSLGMRLQNPLTARARDMIATMNVAALTFAAEALGKEPAAQAVPVLIDLLTHESPIVREGAVYGLAAHLPNHRDARDALDFIATFDISPGVREAADEALEECGA